MPVSLPSLVQIFICLTVSLYSFAWAFVWTYVVIGWLQMHSSKQESFLLLLVIYCSKRGGLKGTSLMSLRRIVKTYALCCSLLQGMSCMLSEELLWYLFGRYTQTKTINGMLHDRRKCLLATTDTSRRVVSNCCNEAHNILIL